MDSMRLQSILAIFLFHSVPYLGAVHGNTSCECQVVENYLTTLVSPEFPADYPPMTRREWNFEIPHGMMGHIEINILKIERFWDTLTLSHISDIAHGTNITTFQLVSGNVTSLLLPSGVVTAHFCSDAFLMHQGFAITVKELRINGTCDAEKLCAQDYLSDTLDFMCDSGMQFIDTIARCDQVVDCHDFTDEMGCSTPDVLCSYRCRDTDICILDTFRCDGWYDCPQRDDEDNCDIAKCPDGYVCGPAPFNDKSPPVHVCKENDWQPFWVNATKPWKKDYVGITATKTTILNIEGIPLTLEVGFFDGLPNINILFLVSCELTHLPPGVFDGLSRLHFLEMANNRLTVLESGVFRNLFYLGVITLENNFVTRFEDGCFQDVQRLFAIDLKYNNITDIKPGTFKNIGSSMERLIMPGNLMTSINSSLFDGIETNLQRVNLGKNYINYIAPETFNNLSKLTDLVITYAETNFIPLHPNIFDGLTSLSALYVYDQRFCCLVPDGVNCINERPPHPLFTCRKTFLQNFTIKVFMWILGVSALLGNTFVLVLRLRSTPTTTVGKVQAMIITNLAMSDLLMGAYMVLLAVMDIYIGESYFWKGRAEEWRASTTCQIAGFLSVLSSETSVFLLTLISVDRFICIMFPFSQRRLTASSTRIAIAVIWVASALLSTVGALLNNLQSDAYGLSDVCVGLPFIRKSTDLQTEVDTRTTSQYGIPYYTTVAGSSVSTWEYSIALFLGINMCSFIVILLSYIAIFIKVRFARAEVGRTNQSANEIKMALKMFLIVGTDFCCWMPIVILGILVQTAGVNITSDIYAWLVVFVLPINSSLNPYLYTIINMRSK